MTPQAKLWHTIGGVVGLLALFAFMTIQAGHMEQSCQDRLWQEKIERLNEGAK